MTLTALGIKEKENIWEGVGWENLCHSNLTITAYLQKQVKNYFACNENQVHHAWSIDAVVVCTIWHKNISSAEVFSYYVNLRWPPSFLNASILLVFYLGKYGITYCYAFLCNYNKIILLKLFLQKSSAHYWELLIKIVSRESLSPKHFSFELISNDFCYKAVINEKQ